MSAKRVILDMGMEWNRWGDGCMMRGRDGLAECHVSIFVAIPIRSSAIDTAVIATYLECTQ